MEKLSTNLYSALLSVKDYESLFSFILSTKDDVSDVLYLLTRRYSRNRNEETTGRHVWLHHKNTDINYNISREKIYHLNGCSRQDYIPEYHIAPSQITSDVILEKGIELIKQ